MARVAKIWRKDVQSLKLARGRFKNEMKIHGTSILRKVVIGLAQCLDQLGRKQKL